MNVLFWVTEYPNEEDWSGIAIYTKLIAESLVRYGHKVFVVTKTKKKHVFSFVMNGVNVWCVPFPQHIFVILERFIPFNFIRFCIRSRKIILSLVKTFKINIIEIQDYLGLGVFLNRSFYRIPVVLRLHGGKYHILRFPQYLHLRNFFFWVFEILAFRRVDYISTPSLYIINKAKRLGLKGEWRLIPNPVVLEKEALMGEKRILDRNKIVFVGKIEVNKGVFDLVRALNYVTHDALIQVDIIGSDKEGISSELMGIKQRNNIVLRFLGKLPHEELLCRLPEYAFAVLPSHKEAFSIVAIECMASGLPIVAYKKTALEEIISDGVNGYLANYLDVVDLARKVEKLLKLDDAEFLKMRKSAYVKASNYYIRNVSQSVKELYFSLMRKK